MTVSYTPKGGAIRLGPGYHRGGTVAIKDTVRAARAMLKDVDFDTFVATGISGALVAPVLAHALGKNVVLVRRSGERAHSSSPASGVLGRRWVFVDDLIDQGDTHKRCQTIIREMAEDRNHQTEQVGVYLYDRSAEGAYSWHPYDYGFTPVDSRDGEE